MQCKFVSRDMHGLACMFVIKGSVSLHNEHGCPTTSLVAGSLCACVQEEPKCMHVTAVLCLLLSPRSIPLLITFRSLLMFECDGNIALQFMTFSGVSSVPGLSIQPVVIH